jgi:hypothetical protein
VSVFAACNMTTERATFMWLVANETVQRQTGRLRGAADRRDSGKDAALRERHGSIPFQSEVPVGRQ